MAIFWFVVVISVLVFVHEAGHFIFARLMKVRVLKFSLGFGPKIIGKKIGDTEYVISAIPLGGYVKMFGEESGEQLEKQDRQHAFNYKPVWQRAVVIFAGPAFNFILAYLIFFGMLAHGLTINIPTMQAILPTIDKIDPNSPADDAGLKKGDVVVAIDEQDIFIWMEMTSIIADSPEKELTMIVERDQEKIEIRITPKAVEVEDVKGEIHTIGRIGVMKQDVIRSVGDDRLNAPIDAAISIYYWSKLIVESVAKLITGDIPAKHIGGPILIGQMSGEAAAIGSVALLMFISIISINLAILNLLPVPILDGGHLVFLSIEAIKGKPLSEKMVGAAHYVGMMLLLALMVFAVYNDILRLITGTLMP